MAAPARHLAEAGSPRSDELRAFADELQRPSGGATRTAPPAGADTRFGRHYWRSDLTVHRRADWAVTARASSTRTHPTEIGDGGNLLGYFLGSGVMTVWRAGHDDIGLLPAIWDWRALPGTTGARVPDSPPTMTWTVGSTRPAPAVGARWTGPATTRPSRPAWSASTSDHGLVPSGAGYTYAVLPSCSVDEFGMWALAPPVQVLARTAELQALRDHRSGVVAATFVQPGGAPVVEVDRSVCLLLDAAAGRVAVAAPDQQAGTVEVRTPHGQARLALPDGGLAGSMVTGWLS